MVPLKFERLQDLDGETANETSRHSLEVVLLDKLVEIHAEELEGEEQVLSEDGVVIDPHDIVLVVFVFALEEAEKAQLNSRLMLESLFIANYFDCYHCPRLVVEAFKCLSKTARPQFVEHLKPVGQVILHDHLVVATLVVEAKVVPEERRSFDFGRVQPQEVNL